MKKLISIVTSLVTLFLLITPTYAAQNNSGVIVKKLNSSDTNEAKFSVDTGSDNFTLDITEEADKNIVIVESSTGEIDRLVYDKINNSFFLNGEELVNEKVNSTSLKENRDISYAYADPGTGGGEKVYLGTYRLNFSKAVSQVGSVATVVAACAAGIAGVSVIAREISVIIAKWSSGIGLSTGIAAEYVTGYWEYSQYRSRYKVRVPNGQMLYKYKNATTYLRFTLRLFNGKSYTLAKSYYDEGNWWFAQKPY